MMTSRSEVLEGALGLAARGVPVIPLRPRSKMPVHSRWPDLGLLDPDAIELEWRLNPDSNVGALCGPEALGGRGLVIVDVDLPDGPVTLEELEKEHGQIPPTASVQTPSGGMHFWLTGQAASFNPGPGLEVRSLGRQCAAPPSTHPNGGRYAWFREGEFAPLPGWMAASGSRAARRHEAAFTPSGLCDPVLQVPPPVYFRKLCGLVPDPQGFVCCPIHGELEPSLKVYPTHDRGWFCYGASHWSGGDVVTLAAELAGIPTPLRGHEFIAALDYLRGRLL